MSTIRLGPPAALRERLRQLDVERRRIRTFLSLAEREERELRSSQAKDREQDEGYKREREQDTRPEAAEEHSER